MCVAPLGPSTWAHCARPPLVAPTLQGYWVWGKLVEALADVGYDPNNLVRSNCPVGDGAGGDQRRDQEGLLSAAGGLPPPHINPLLVALLYIET